MKLSEFTLKDKLTVDGKVFEKGSKCPESEVPRLLRHNREYLELEYKSGIPQITKEQEEKYGVSFTPEPPKEMKILPREFSQEKLNVKLADVGAKKFKEWAEKKFGADKIDRRKSAKSIITEILRMQEEARR
uniref:Uncharacterized protein n=1 Tax=viral metagenome TaxID=1070528 RepID=A0A6M3L511_9ZZZZ